MKTTLTILLIALLLHGGITMRGKSSKKLTSSEPPTKQFQLLEKSDGYYIPAKIGKADFDLRLSGNAVPSWGILGKGQFCLSKDGEPSCQKVSTKIKCEDDCSKTPLDSENQNGNGYEISAKDKVQLKYVLGAGKDGSQDITGTFLDASKVTLKDASMAYDPKSSAMVNVADWNSFTLKQKGKDVLMTIDQQDFSKEEKVISVPSASSSSSKNEEKKNPGTQPEGNQEEGNADAEKKELSAGDKDKSSGKEGFSGYIIANQEQETKIPMPMSKISFDYSSGQNDFLLSLPAKAAKSLRKLLSKKYLESKCSLQQDGSTLKCKSKPDAKNIPIDICLDDKNCIRVNADSLVSKASSKKYKIMFTTSDEDDTIVVSGKFLECYSLAFQKGEITQFLRNPDYELASLLSDEADSDAQENKGNDEQEEEAIPIPKTRAREDNLARNRKSILATVLLTIGAYCIIAVVVIFMIRCNSKESFVAKTIDFAFGAIAGYFYRWQGYEAPKMGEEIDDGNTVAYGYEKENAKGKEMFWEKNSVEGI